MATGRPRGICNNAEGRPLRCHWRLPYAETASRNRQGDNDHCAIGDLPLKVKGGFCRKAGEVRDRSLLLTLALRRDPMIVAGLDWPGDKIKSS